MPTVACKVEGWHMDLHLSDTTFENLAAEDHVQFTLADWIISQRIKYCLTESSQEQG